MEMPSPSHRPAETGGAAAAAVTVLVWVLSETTGLEVPLHVITALIILVGLMPAGITWVVAERRGEHG